MSVAENTGKRISWPEAAQGDILSFSQLLLWTGEDSEFERFPTPDGVVLITQTCDLVRPREGDRVTVAPIVAQTAAELSGIHKGRKPLLVTVGSKLQFVADLERMTSIPRSALEDSVVLDRTSREQSGRAAANLGARIARGFSRFAFPDEVNTALSKLQKRVAQSHSKATPFAAVLRQVLEFRVACDDWNRGSRHLTIYAIVHADYLPAADMKPDDWEFSHETVKGVTRSMRPEQLSLEKLSELILANAAVERDPALVALWEYWAMGLQDAVMSFSDVHVKSIEFEVRSSLEFTYEDWTNSEAIDFSALSAESSIAVAEDTETVEALEQR